MLLPSPFLVSKAHPFDGLPPHLTFPHSRGTRPRRLGRGARRRQRSSRPADCVGRTHGRARPHLGAVLWLPHGRQQAEQKKGRGHPQRLPRAEDPLPGWAPGHRRPRGQLDHWQGGLPDLLSEVAQNILASDKESKAVFKGMGANECILDLNWRDLGGLACLEPSIKVLRSAADSAGKLTPSHSAVCRVELITAWPGERVHLDLLLRLAQKLDAAPARVPHLAAAACRPSLLSSSHHRSPTPRPSVSLSQARSRTATPTRSSSPPCCASTRGAPRGGSASSRSKSSSAPQGG